MTPLSGILLDEIVARALAEDLGNGDLTTEAIVDPGEPAVARAVSGQSLVVSGGEVLARVFYAVDRAVRVEALHEDGTQVGKGEVLFLVEGSARSLLMGERTALNFVQRLSGIATLTRSYVDRIPAGSLLRITDTRKTTPGLRALERWAVRSGGGKNHRADLGAAILIKDNHIALAGGVGEAVKRARAAAPHTSRIEVEIESLSALGEALDAGADVVLLDNFAESDLAEAAKRARGRALVEVSGGLTPDRIPRLAELGVDVASVGALTHSAPAVDISLEIEPLRGP